MKKRTLRLAAALLLLAAGAQAQTTAVPSLINFQGRLARPDGTPVLDSSGSNVYNLTFSLWDDPTATTAAHQRWTQTVSGVKVRNGAFAVLLGSGNPLTDTVINGSVYLQIQVNSAAPLTPRQQLVSNAYALKANTVPDGAITNVKIAAGTITADKFAPGVTSSLAWLLGGNAGTNPANNFLGATDNQPVVFKSNNYRSLQIQYAKNLYDATNKYYLEGANVLGGYSGNVIGAGIVGATVFGGYLDSQYYSAPNQALSSGSTVSGGIFNTAGFTSPGQYDGLAATVGGGFLNTAGQYCAVVSGGRLNRATNLFSGVSSGDQNVCDGYASIIAGGAHNQINLSYDPNSQFTQQSSTISGGYGNITSSYYDTIGGGNANTTGGNSAVVAGGTANSAGADYSAVSGGNLNTASGVGASVGGGIANFAAGDDSTVAGGGGNQAQGFGSFAAGGNNNLAQGDNSFAAGRQAQAMNTGTFVWADNHAANFASTKDNSFLVRAAGGVGINTASPGAGFALDVSGLIRTTGPVNTASDARFKTHVAGIENALDAILNLHGVTYDYDRAQWPDRNFPAGKQMGFLAQEVERVFPELVTKDEKGYRSVAYTGVIPALVEAVKTLKSQVDDKQKQIDELRASNAELKRQNAEIADLKKQITELIAALKKSSNQPPR